MKVLILTDKCGSVTNEDEADTLLEVKAVKQALRTLDHTAQVVEFSLNLPVTAARIERSGCDMVFNLVENLSSSRLLHLVPMLCETLSIPCSGGDAYTLLATGDKLIAKRLLRTAGLPTPDWVDAGGDRKAFLGSPMILKPVAQEASIGISDASVRSFSNSEELDDALTKHREYFAERYIDGREFNLSILPGGIILPVCEMQFVDYPAGKAKIVGYEAKWKEASFAYRHTCRNYIFQDKDASLTMELRRLASAAYRLFGSSGYARIDFRVDKAGKPYILEMNSNPCITADSGFIAAAEQAGLSYSQVIERLLER